MEDGKKPEEGTEQDSAAGEETPKFRGLYRYVHVSVKTLDIIIIACVVVIVVVTALSMKDRGFMVNFDSQGGTDVAAAKYQYGEHIEPPESPTREGYSFTGWFIDPNCQEQWIIEENTVNGALTLYAGWEKDP